MKKLHADGLLESLDYESFETCEPYPMGKMTKTLFPKQWSGQERGGYHYFLFMDDLS